MTAIVRLFRGPLATLAIATILPLFQVWHQQQHHRHTSATRLASAQVTTVSALDDDESHCLLCQVLVTRGDDGALPEQPLSPAHSWNGIPIERPLLLGQHWCLPSRAPPARAPPTRS